MTTKDNVGLKITVLLLATNLRNASASVRIEESCHALKPSPLAVKVIASDDSGLDRYQMRVTEKGAILADEPVEAIPTIVGMMYQGSRYTLRTDTGDGANLINSQTGEITTVHCSP